MEAASSKLALAKAQQFCNAADYESAYPCLGDALSWLRATEDHYHTAYALMWMAEWHYQEDLSQALRWCREADSLLRHHPQIDTVSFYPALLQSLGYFSSLEGLIDEQMGYYRRAFDLALRVYGPVSEEAAEAYCDMGVAYITRGSLAAGILYCDSSIMVSKQGGYHDKLTRPYNNAAHALADAGNLLKAISYQQMALEHADSSFLSYGYNNLGDYHLLLGNFEESLRCFEQGLSILEQEEQVSADQVMLRVNIARAYFDMDDKNEAYCILGELLALPDTGVEDMSYLKQSVFLTQAVFAYRTGDYLAAVQFINDMKRLSMPQIWSFMHLVRAKAYIQLNEFDKAARDVEKCLALALPDFYRSAPSDALPPAQSVENAAQVAEILAAKGDLLHKQANATGDAAGHLAALAVFSLADSLIQRARRGIQNRASREALSVSIRDVYQGNMALLYSMYALRPDTAIFEQALNVAEESKALVLAEKMSDDDAKAFADVPSSVLARDRALAEDVRLYTEQVAKGGQEAAAWKRKLADKHLEQEGFLDSLEIGYPNYYALRYQAKPVTLADIRQYLIAEDEVLMEYFLTDEALFVLVADHKEHRFLRLPLPRRPLAAQVLAYKAALLAPGHAWSVPAHDLYCALLGAAEAFTAGRNLVLVPDDVLSYMPFEALLYEPLPIDGVSPRAFPYLLRRHGCRYLFSPGVAIQSLQRSKEAVGSGVLAMAPLCENGRGLSAFLRAKGEDLGFLPHTASELEGIASRFGGAYLTGRRATEAYLKDHAADFTVLHLATHTEIDEQQADHSALVLADDDTQDGLLKAHELYTMKLRARLVTLSTCNTVNGRMQRGGGVASLARAFAYAGCPNLVATMWQVQDGTTSVLMGRMYGHIAEGLPVNRALHQAKLDLLDKENTLHAHPALWSAFVYLGNEEVLVLPAAVPASGWGFYGFLLGLGLLLAFFGVRMWLG